MSIPTYQVFNIDKEDTDTCGGENTGYIKRTNYILDSFRKREITNGESIKDEGERRDDGVYNLEQQKYSPKRYSTEGFFDIESLSPTLIVISSVCAITLLYIIYKVVTKKRRNVQNDLNMQF